MPFTMQLIEGSLDPINLYYLADDGWSLLDKGFEPNDPERRELWGGYLETTLIRQEDGKRVIPSRFYMEQADTNAFIDAVNALEERLRHAARYRIGDWGNEVFLRFQLHGATYGVDFPVSSGRIDKNDVFNICNAAMDGAGERTIDRSNSIEVVLVCEPYWESTATYTLENYIDNPGWWRGAAPGDSWTEVNAGDVATFIDTTTYEVMGQSLRLVISPDGALDTGVQSDAITVVALTQYYLEARVYGAIGNDPFTVQAFDLIGGVPGTPIAGSVITFPAAAVGWVKAGISFVTPAFCTSLAVQCFRLFGNSSALDKTYRLDALYLGTLGQPIGWSSGRNLVNHLDAGADHLNVLCVTEIPGEVEAEAKYTINLGDTVMYLRAAKRTRDTPANFIWELNADTAYTTVDAHYGLTDAMCIDSLKDNDATCPVAHRITVTFATTQTMITRCYWSIASNLLSYYGDFVLFVIAKMSGAADTATIQIAGYDEGSYIGLVNKQTVSGTSWKLKDGWEILTFRVGSSDNALFGAGNNWMIQLRASTSGAPTDSLYIAGAYLVPVDEALVLAGGYNSAATYNWILKMMDGDIGLFPYDSATDIYYPNKGFVGGAYPLLEPEIENWLYFAVTGYLDVWTYDDVFSVAVNYRPRGIFLRGSNP